MAVPSPPASTLSTPSPTTQEPTQPSHQQPQSSQAPTTAPSPAMPPIPKPKPIYLIVATSVSPSMGIGNKGTLPWPGIRSDMAFFKRVTTTPPTTSPSTPPTTRPGGSSSPLNAVLMGRKTYSSIPTKFRPLDNRLNVIITRSDVLEVGQGILSSDYQSLPSSGKSSGGKGKASGVRYDMSVLQSGEKVALLEAVRKPGHATSQEGQGRREGKGEGVKPSTLVCSSVERALEVVDQLAAADEHSALVVDKVFCIGGAEIYRSLLMEERLKGRCRIVQTLVKKVDGDGEGFECDTFFPVTLGQRSGSGEAERQGVVQGDGWRVVEKETVQEWMGVDLPQGSEEWVRDDKAGVEIKVVGWEPRG